MTKIKAITIISLLIAFGCSSAIAEDDANSSGGVIVHADVYGPGFCGCDFIRDGAINFDDFAVFILEWGKEDCSSFDNWCDESDLNHDNRVNYKDMAIIAGCWLDEDVTPPWPDPMQWDLSIDGNGFDGLPREVFLGPDSTWDWGVTMRADPNTYDDTNLEFFFDCTNLSSGFDSGWISFPSGPPYEYTVNLGGKGWLSQWRVRARDRSINNDINITGWSSSEIAE